MTTEEWVYTLNTLITKTRGGKIAWKPSPDVGGAVALVGDLEVHFLFKGLKVNGEPVAQVESLKIELRRPGGAVLAELSHEEAKAAGGQVADLALQNLFAAVVVEPRKQAIEDFRKALGEL
jgi:hypothetical protein